MHIATRTLCVMHKAEISDLFCQCVSVFVIRHSKICERATGNKIKSGSNLQKPHLNMITNICMKC
jgi:hypothetical protein